MSFLHAQNEKSGFEFPLCGGGGMMTKESLAIPKLPAFCRTYGVSQGERSRATRLGPRRRNGDKRTCLGSRLVRGDNVNGNASAVPNAAGGFTHTLDAEC
jgi:hypothetical protein